MSSNPADRLPFEHLIDQLGRQGFRTGVEHYLRLRVLLSRIGDDCSPADLKTVLCPVFATTAEQQESFYRAFDSCYPFLGGDEPAAVGRVQHVEGTSHTAPTAAVRRRPYVLTGLAIALAIAVAVWTTPWNRSAPPAADIEPTDTASLPSPTVTSSPSQSPWVTGYAATRTEVWWIAVAGPLLLWFVWELHRFRRRELAIRRAHGKTPPYSWPVRADYAPEVYEPHELAAVGRVLHRRYHSESERFDVMGTVAASIASLGFPTFRYRRDTRLPEYLFLIDRASYRDHQSQLYEHLATMLRAHGLHVGAWFFEGDPRVCWSQTGDEPVHLTHLLRTCQSHRVLLFGAGEQLLDAVTGALAPCHQIFEGWTDRAILTPEPVSQWSARELTLATQFAVVPATLEGLAALAVYFELPQSVGRRLWDGDGPSDAPLAAAEIDALRRYLGADVFQWLCACAVYPELQWSLTLRLGALPAMAAGLVCEGNLAKLLQLEWFRAGSIPDDRRRELVAQLDPRIEREVRQAIVSVLEESPALAGTFAAGAQRFQIAYQRSRLAPKDRQARGALRAALQNVPPDEIVSDYAYLDAAESVSQSPLQLVLPRRLRRLFYPAGLPWMGMRSTATLMLALAIAAGAFQILRVADRRILQADAASASVVTSSTLATEPPLPPPPGSVKGPTLKELLAPEERARLLTVTEDGGRTVIILQGSEVFRSGSADVNTSHLGTLDRIVAALNQVPGRVLVIGYADDQALRSYELAGERAISIAQILRRTARSPTLINASPWSSSLPAGSDPERRARDRGVEIIHFRGEPLSPMADRTAAPPPTDKPAPPPITAEEHAKQEIGQLVKNYCTALGTLNAANVRSLFLVDNERLLVFAEQFRQYKSLKCTVTAPPAYERLDASPAGTAQLTFGMRQAIEMQSGGGPKVLDMMVTMVVSRRDFQSPWLIDRLSYEPAPVPSPPQSAADTALANAAIKSAILDLLARYKQALEGRSLEALKQIWPSLGDPRESTIRAEFEQAQAIDVNVVDPRINVSGDVAVVTFSRHYELQPKSGPPMRAVTPTTMTLRRTAAGWVIEQVRFGAPR